MSKPPQLKDPTLLFWQGEQSVQVTPVEDVQRGAEIYRPGLYWLNGKPIEFWIEESDKYRGFVVHSNRPPDENNPNESDLDPDGHPERFVSYDHDGSRLPDATGWSIHADRVIAWGLEVLNGSGATERIAVSLAGYVAVGQCSIVGDDAKVILFPKGGRDGNPGVQKLPDRTGTEG
jgi:hypothetical protein